MDTHVMDTSTITAAAACVIIVYNHSTTGANAGSPRQPDQLDAASPEAAPAKDAGGSGISPASRKRLQYLRGLGITAAPRSRAALPEVAPVPEFDASDVSFSEVGEALPEVARVPEEAGFSHAVAPSELMAPLVAASVGCTVGRLQAFSRYLLWLTASNGDGRVSTSVEAWTS